jgi:hypothetical protein
VLQDVLDSLQVKLGITAMSSFSLVVEHVKSLKRNKLTLLNPKDTLSKVGRLNPSVSKKALFFSDVLSHPLFSPKARHI